LVIKHNGLTYQVTDNLSKDLGCDLVYTLANGETVEIVHSALGRYCETSKGYLLIPRKTGAPVLTLKESNSKIYFPYEELGI
jgi:hypothetical protein